MRAYFRYIDSALADLAEARGDGEKWNEGWITLFYFPLLVTGVPFVISCLVLNWLTHAMKASNFLICVYGGLMIVHTIYAFYRWSIFDYEDYTGKKLRSIPEESQ